MGVDVSGGGEGAVPQPNLDLLHGDTVAQQQTCTGVPLWHNKLFSFSAEFRALLVPVKRCNSACSRFLHRVARMRPGGK